MTISIVKMFSYNKFEPSLSKHFEDVAYIVDTSDPNDMDALFREVLKLADQEFHRHWDDYVNANGSDSFYAAWQYTLYNMNIVTNEAWRHSKGVHKPPQIVPAKTRNGEYLPLTFEEKDGLFYDCLISHGYLPADYSIYFYDREIPTMDNALGSYWRWLEANVPLDNDNLSEIDEFIL